MRGTKQSVLAVAGSAAVALMTCFTGSASAGTFDLGVPGGWTCAGNCGTSGASGVVTLAPVGGTQYGFVSTASGQSGVGLAIGGVNGSKLQSHLFTANAGEALEFYFNYVTSDGLGYADYAWARLLDGSGSEVARLFTARTTQSGDAVPGFDVPAPIATLTPSPVTIIGGNSTWAPLGASSGTCYHGPAAGCGYTGWIKSQYTIAAGGSYRLEFGATNWGDSAYDSGLAFDGVTVAGAPIEVIPTVPEPATLALLGLALAAAARRRRAQ